LGRPQEAIVSRSHLALILALGGIAGLSAPALGGWSANPVTVRPTTSSIPLVAACADGGLGAFVAWQEEASAGSGQLRAQHLLPTGDLDPAWPIDGALVSDGFAARTDLGALPDRLAGLFVWWSEPNSVGPRLYLTRVAPNGSIGAGWPTRGRLVGTISSLSPAPRALSDGASGVYLVWTAQNASSDPTIVKVAHLGPANTGVNGWPSSPRTVTPDDDPVATIDLWPRIALAPDGGLFVAWASWSLEETTIPSSYRLRRLTAAGLNAGGWPLEGIAISPFHPDRFGDAKKAAMLALSADGRGGLWALVGDVESPDPYAEMITTLFRLLGDGTSAADWPAAGRPMTTIGSWFYQYGSDALSLRAESDGMDGVILGIPATCADCGTPLSFDHVSAGGAVIGLGQGQAPGLEAIVRPDGGCDLGSFEPHGPTGPYQPPAYLAFDQTAGPRFFEYHPENGLVWFGDVGLAPCGPSGAVFFWSQVRERLGLFARRFGLAGEVTGVGNASKAVIGLHDVCFVAGRGVVARVDLAGAPGTLRLFDLAGRVVSTSEVHGSGRVEVAMPSTKGISSGLYFARLTTAAGRESGKVVVAH
jgi:hypothetical protein